jgi:hypothetical protein
MREEISNESNAAVQAVCQRIATLSSFGTQGMFCTSQTVESKEHTCDIRLDLVALASYRRLRVMELVSYDFSSIYTLAVAV